MKIGLVGGGRGKTDLPWWFSLWYHPPRREERQFVSVGDGAALVSRARRLVLGPVCHRTKSLFGLIRIRRFICGMPTMQQLWVRVSAALGILSTLGGGTAYYLRNADFEEAGVPMVAQASPERSPAVPLPLHPGSGSQDPTVRAEQPFDAGRPDVAHAAGSSGESQAGVVAASWGDSDRGRGGGSFPTVPTDPTAAQPAPPDPYSSSSGGAEPRAPSYDSQVATRAAAPPADPTQLPSGDAEYPTSTGHHDRGNDPGDFKSPDGSAFTPLRPEPGFTQPSMHSRAANQDRPASRLAAPETFSEANDQVEVGEGGAANADLGNAPSGNSELVNPRSPQAEPAPLPSDPTDRFASRSSFPTDPTTVASTRDAAEGESAANSHRGANGEPHEPAAFPESEPTRPVPTGRTATSIAEPTPWLSGTAATPISDAPSSDAVGEASSAIPPGDRDLSAPLTDRPRLASPRPGPRNTEGRQQPTIVIEKRAPAEIQVGQPAQFELVIQNPGQTIAHQVIITDQIPAGTRFVDSVPPPTEQEGDLVAWQIEQLAPGDAATITIQLLPLTEGEIGSVAQVSFQAQASVRTRCTKPELVVEQRVPEKVLIGEEAIVQIAVMNQGSGAATKILLEENVPAGLAHAAGQELEYEIGTLQPGETRRLELSLKAVQAGMVENRLTVRAANGVAVEHAAAFEVTAPQLQVELAGPKRRYVDREVTYQVGVGNPGTAMANQVALVAHLPKGLKFVSTGGQGRYHAATHTVHWALQQLGPGEEGFVELTAVPQETGDLKLRLEGVADRNLTSSSEWVTAVDGIVGLVFSISDLHDPIELGRPNTYEIRVANQGTKPATGVQLLVDLASGLTPVSGEGPTRVTISQQAVQIAPLEQLAAGEEAVYQVTVEGTAVGDHLLNVSLKSAEVTTPVTKQESTKVYSDQ